MGIALERGNILYQQQRFDLALRELEQEVQAEPGNPIAYAMMALCHLNLQRFVAARRCSECAISLDPSGWMGHHALAWTLYNDFRFTSRRPGDTIDPKEHVNKTRLKMADAAVREALRLSPRIVDLFVLKSLIALDSLNPREALRTANEGLALDPSSDGCHRVRACVLRTFGDLTGAEAASQAALSLNPLSPANHVDAGWTALYAGDYHQARRHFVEALRISPNEHRIRTGLLHALRARFSFYRPILWIRLRHAAAMCRPKSRAAYILLAMILAACLINALSELDKSREFLRVTGLLLGIPVFLGILSHGLASYLLLFDPLGHSVLSRKDRVMAIATSIILVEASMFGVLWYVSFAPFWHSWPVLVTGVIAGLLIVIVPTIAVRMLGRRRRLAMPLETSTDLATRARGDFT